MNLTVQQNEALRTDKQIALTANAGSGKTFVLSKRFVKLVLDDGILISKIVAITFTDKAAGELYKKIEKEINNQIEDKENEPNKFKLERLRKQLVSANISTIHSFCSELLREFPIEAGIDANFLVMEKKTQSEMKELSVQEMIKDAVTVDDDFEKYKKLIRIFGGRKKFITNITSLFNERKKISSLMLNSDFNDIEKLTELYESGFYSYLATFVNENLSEFVKTVVKINSFAEPEKKFRKQAEMVLAQIENTADSFEKIYLSGQIDILNTKNELRSKGYLEDDIPGSLADDEKKVKSYKKSIEVFNSFFELRKNSVSSSDELKAAIKSYHHSLAELSIDLYSLTNRAFVIYEQKKKTKGVLDYDDMIIKAESLSKIPEVKKYLSEKYSYIMIDEFQDTDHLQYSIFMSFLENLSKGNLFVVGDEKQSIYMFRGAEPEVFGKTKEEISLAAEGLSIVLPHSFRLFPAIAQFVNETFGVLLSNKSGNYSEVEYNDFICAKELTETGSVNLLISEGKEQSNEAKLIAGMIRKIIYENPGKYKYSDIAVLSRKKAGFTEIEEVFNEFEIPYIIVGGRGFFNQQSVLDIAEFLSFLLDECNDSALIGILRSPFFMISDKELYEISCKEGETFYKKLKEYYSEQNYIIDTLEEAIKLSKYLEIDLLIERIYEMTGYKGVIAARKNPDQELANINKLKSIALSFSKNEYGTLYDFVSFLTESKKNDEDESQAAFSGAGNAVQIMTIHKSKGLEFKVLFVYKTNEAPNNNKISKGDVYFDGKYGLLFKIPQEMDYWAEYQTPGIVSVAEINLKMRELAERKRLLYVALTRGAEHLYITASKDRSIKTNSFLAMIVDSLKIDLNLETHTIKSKLRIRHDDGTEKDEELETDIRIIKDIDEFIIDENVSRHPDMEVKDYSSRIPGNERKEIISATKIAIFNFCPVRYHLTYNLGFSKLQKLISGQGETGDYFGKEDSEEEFLPASIKGSIIHKILEVGGGVAEIERTVKSFSQKELRLDDIKDEDLSEIAEIIEKYYKSDYYKKISSITNFKTEVEIYSEFYDNYIYGIIDRLAFIENKVIIVDYKTDRISKERILDRAKDYESQMRFYSLLVSAMYPGKDIEINLVFIKQPDTPVIYQITAEEITAYSEKLNETIIKIQSGNQEKNQENCAKCQFQSNSNCIIQI